MKVRMLTLSASANGVFEPGMVQEVPEKVGKDMIDKGFAAKHDGKAPVKQSPDDEDVAASEIHVGE